MEAKCQKLEKGLLLRDGGQGCPGMWGGAGHPGRCQDTSTAQCQKPREQTEQQPGPGSDPGGEGNARLACPERGESHLKSGWGPQFVHSDSGQATQL